MAETRRNLLKKESSVFFSRRFIIIIIAGRNYRDLVSTIRIHYIHCERRKKVLLFPQQTLTISRSRWLNTLYYILYPYLRVDAHPLNYTYLTVVLSCFNIISSNMTCETMTFRTCLYCDGNLPKSPTRRGHKRFFYP